MLPTVLQGVLLGQGWQVFLADELIDCLSAVMEPICMLYTALLKRMSSLHDQESMARTVLPPHGAILGLAHKSETSQVMASRDLNHSLLQLQLVPLDLNAV